MDLVLGHSRPEPSSSTVQIFSLGCEGTDLAVARRIREDYRPGSVTIPYHRGAVAFYNREEPAFFVEYAEAISLGLTLLVGLYSGSIAEREWMRRQI